MLKIKRKKDGGTDNKKARKEKEKENESIKISAFFNSWFYLSVIILLLTIILSSFSNRFSHSYSYIINILIDLFKNIGLAIFVANIFTFIMGTEQFLNYIRKRLVDIVLSKDFVAKLSKSEQHNLLHLTLKPPKDLSLVYSRINDYFDNYINSSLNLFENSYRGHLHINAVASFDESKKRVRIESEYDFIVYKVNEKFEPINIYFEDEESELIVTKVDSIELKTSDAETPSDVKARGVKRGYSLKVPDELNDRQHLNVYRKIVEYGDNHWQLFVFKSIQPYDGMLINLRCEDGLCIKKHLVYGRQNDFIIEPFNRGVRIKHIDWVVPGFGVSVTVVKGSHEHCEECRCIDCESH
ncbi:hypothetical protein OF66_0542 [Seleniivibrio woodruffii]|uniref:Uncharacterized protein n=2 Tax=Seleniivibrio woodruffii TaxID=1078050 RepID=A0A4R1KD74_9BACT|nr:hypothetical protein [Seleniivibrio woodruffii]TCK61943.1 hypothetical protein C8D98_0450 [Seleniivibrio woodruffii]TVZ34940.1 hypothetical protein OF66_0542 [Seleniivibrio woodruffii]